MVMNSSFLSRMRRACAVELAPASDALESLAQLAALDLVVIVDASWAHMAGAIRSRPGGAFGRRRKGPRPGRLRRSRFAKSSREGLQRPVGDVMVALRGDWVRALIQEDFAMSRLTPARVLTLIGLAALAGCAGTGRLPQDIPEIHDPGPSRTTPTQGAAPDPIAPGPQGSLPNPYVNPPRR